MRSVSFKSFDVSPHGKNLTKIFILVELSIIFRLSKSPLALLPEASPILGIPLVAAEVDA
jgi:hypothetical protein